MDRNEFRRHNAFQARCTKCPRNMVWVEVGADENHRTTMTFQAHKYVVDFGTPEQRLVTCENSGQPYKF